MKTISSSLWFPKQYIMVDRMKDGTLDNGLWSGKGKRLSIAIQPDNVDRQSYSIMFLVKSQICVSIRSVARFQLIISICYANQNARSIMYISGKLRDLAGVIIIANGL